MTNIPRQYCIVHSPAGVYQSCYQGLPVPGRGGGGGAGGAGGGDDPHQEQEQAPS